MPLRVFVVEAGEEICYLPKNGHHADIVNATEYLSDLFWGRHVENPCSVTRHGAFNVVI